MKYICCRAGPSAVDWLKNDDRSRIGWIDNLLAATKVFVIELYTVHTPDITRIEAHTRRIRSSVAAYQATRRPTSCQQATAARQLTDYY